MASNLAQRGTIKARETQTFHKQATILDTDRDPLDMVLRRSKSLLTHISNMPKSPSMNGLADELANLQEKADATDIKDTEARREIFDDLCELRRRIAFSNPLLDFDELLISKRRLQVYSHMCDQYYGMAATPGGGLYVLSDAFGAAPRVRDVP